MKALAAFALAVLLAGCVRTAPPLGEPDLQEASRINTQLGVDYLQKGRLDLAREKLERAISQDGRNALAHAMLALVLAQQGEVQQAERAYRHALDLDPDNADTLNNFGIFLCRQERRLEAERMFLRAARGRGQVRPEVALTNAGVCLRPVDPERAQALLREALERRPDFPEALAQLAALSLAQGDALRARAFLQRYEAVAQHLPETLWIGYMAERALGDEQAAARYRTRLRELFPDSPQARQLESR